MADDGHTINIGVPVHIGQPTVSGLDLDAIERELSDDRCRTCDGQGCLPDPDVDDMWGDDCSACGGRGRTDVGRHVLALVAEVRRLRAERDFAVDVIRTLLAGGDVGGRLDDLNAALKGAE